MKENERFFLNKQTTSKFIQNDSYRVKISNHHHSRARAECTSDSTKYATQTQHTQGLYTRSLSFSINLESNGRRHNILRASRHTKRCKTRIVFIYVYYDYRRAITAPRKPDRTEHSLSKICEIFRVRSRVHFVRPSACKCRLVRRVQVQVQL